MLRRFITQKIKSTTGLKNRLPNLLIRSFHNDLDGPDEIERAEFMRELNRKTQPGVNSASPKFSILQNIFLEKEAREKIERFMTEITTQETKSIEAVDKKKASAIQEVGAQETRSIEAVDKKETSSIQAVGVQETRSIEAVDKKETSSIQAVGVQETRSIEAVDKKEASSIQAVGVQETRSIEAVDKKKASAIQEVGAQETRSIAAVDKKETSSIQAVGAQEIRSIEAVDKKETSSIQAVGVQETRSIEAVDKKETSSIQAVGVQETRSIEAVGKKEASSIQAVGVQETRSIEAVDKKETSSIQAVGVQETRSIEAVDKKEASSIQAVSAQETRSIEAVGKREASSIQAVGVQETRSIEAVGKKEANSIQAVGVQETRSIEAVDKKEASSIQAVGVQETRSIEAVGKKEANSIQAVGVQETRSIEAVGKKEAGSIQAVGAQETRSIEAVSKKEASSIQAVGVQETRSIEAVGKKEAGSIQAVGAQETRSIEAVSKKEASSIQAVGEQEKSLKIKMTTMEEQFSKDLEKLKKEAENNAFKLLMIRLLIVPVVALVTIYSVDRFLARMRRKEATKLFDLMLENSSHKAFYINPQINAEKTKIFSDRWSAFVAKLFSIKPLLLLLSNGSSVDSTNLFLVAQFLISDAENDIADIVLENMLSNKDVITMPLFHMLKGINAYYQQQYRSASEDFQEAEKLCAEDDFVMKARIQILQARLFMDNSEVLLKTVLETSKLNTKHPHILGVALRDLLLYKVSGHGTQEEIHNLDMYSEKLASLKLPNNSVLQTQCTLLLQALKQKTVRAFDTTVTRESCALIEKKYDKSQVHQIMPYVAILKRVLRDQKKLVLPFDKIVETGLVSTDYEYALMSQQAYADTISLEKLEENKWQYVDASERDTSFDNAPGLRAVVFKNSSRKEIVIAFRGTQLTNVHNAMTDIYAAMGISDIHFTAAKVFAEKMWNKHTNSEAEKYKLILTGHSLGGWIAEYTLYCLSQSKSCRYIEAVTFDSPGSEKLIANAHKNIITPLTLELLPLRQYLSEPNFVNTLCRHLPTTRIRLDIHYTDENLKGIMTNYEWLNFFWLTKLGGNISSKLVLAAQQTLSTHKLDGFIDKLNPMNDAYAHDIISWPQGALAYDAHREMQHMARKKGVKSPSDIAWQLPDLHEWEQVKDAVKLHDPYSLPKNKIHPRIWKYLQEYLKTHGEYDESANKEILNYEMRNDVLHSLVEYPVQHLIRYVEIKIREREFKQSTTNFHTFFDEARRSAKVQAELRRVERKTQVLSNPTDILCVEEYKRMSL